jgi:hypothetical protein|tara:strand:+ start:968 stop:2947 length:1980 start_codon:yes stop_codon:yes gene_type:complete
MNMKLEDQLFDTYRAEMMLDSQPVDAPIKMQEGGTVLSPEQMALMGQAQEAVVESAVTQDPKADIAAAIEEMMMQAQMTDDPTERQQYEHLAEAAMVGANAPMAEQAIALANAGRGDDTALAHLRPGEVVLPPEAFEDEDFERAVQRRFEELDIDPHQAVVGLGIASLNPITGLEEFGFFKKLAKGVKKVVKKVIKPLAKVAQFIPGPWQPIAALVNKAYTVYDVAKGNISPLALLTVAGPGATGGSIGSNINAIKGASASGGFFSGLGSSLANTGTAIRSGIGSLASNPMGTLFGGPGGTGGIPGLLKSASYSGQPLAPGVSSTVTGALTGNVAGGPTTMFGKAASTLGGMGAGAMPGGAMPGVASAYTIQPGDTLSAIAAAFGTDVATLMANNPHITDPNMIQAGGQLNVPGAPAANSGGLFTGGGADGVGNFGMAGDFLGGITDKFGLTNYGGANTGTGTGTGSGFGGKDVAAFGLAGLMAKLAYDEAKNAKGVAQTPMTSMNSAGRYNIEAEIARRMGKEAPNPTEFGLLPANTFPTMSGGRATPPRDEEPMAARYGGPVMRFAEGGNVAMQDFIRMDGGIDGEGTEISDDIPAMLSDGEFVMTGQAVRGAGAFQMKKDGGIITLEPLGKESRDKGTKLMYDMMSLFKDFAGEPA